MHWCRFISLSWTRPENQSEINYKKGIAHQRALVQIYFSCMDQAGKPIRNQLQKRNIILTCTGACLFLLPGQGRKTNPKSSAGKGNLTTSHSGYDFTQ